MSASDWSQRRCLVTGGAGFLGGHVVRALRDRGADVRVLDPAPLRNAPEGVEHIRASVADPGALARALDGVSWVFHLAAVAHLWRRDPRDFDRVNRIGTERLLAAVGEHAAIERVVCTGTEAILGARRPSGTLIDERTPLPPHDEMPGPYTRSKHRADELARAAVAHGLPVVRVYPTTPIGPHDPNLTAPTRLLRELLAGRIPAYLDCRLNLVPAAAVADGHLLAAERGQPGEGYILGGDNLALSELIALLGELSDRPMPSRRVPYPVALASARCAETLARITGRAPLASVEGVRLAGRELVFDCRKAREDLAWEPGDLRACLRETIDWLLAGPKPSAASRATQ